MVGTDRWAVPVRNGVEDGTNVVRLASRGSCPAEDGEAPDSGQRSALSLPQRRRSAPSLPQRRRSAPSLPINGIKKEPLGEERLSEN